MCFDKTDSSIWLYFLKPNKQLLSWQVNNPAADAIRTDRECFLVRVACVYIFFSYSVHGSHRGHSGATMYSNCRKKPQFTVYVFFSQTYLVEKIQPSGPGVKQADFPGSPLQQRCWCCTAHRGEGQPGSLMSPCLAGWARCCCPPRKACTPHGNLIAHGCRRSTTIRVLYCITWNI